MYNKYIGNTGKFVRVEDHPRAHAHNAERSVALPPPTHAPIQQHSESVKQAVLSPRLDGHKNKSLFGGLGGGLNNLFGGLGGGLGGILGGGGSGGGLGKILGGGGGLGGLTGGFKGMFDHLPFGLDLGDILLFLMLLFFFIESGDEEFIIILAIIAYNMFKER